eukprot:CAMPEP_0117662242 /NCGR_PEP_ID=MMETSP0804-20121206/7951_1 /TAXON_ID=1074897 /ORGANISM="Tetraselmis astigmatica, Strain CCMP880" /LENGTH=564 /DNA_ID=CAMNT_0005469133 /DNA_START=577 /DNA_END=2274 /DNA_ORIENTATION=+
MTSSLSGWVERPQLNRQKSSEKVIQQIVAATGQSVQLRPWSAESAAVKAGFKPVRCVLPELESGSWGSTLPVSLCRNGSLPVIGANSYAGLPATAPGKLGLRNASLTLPPVFPVCAPSEAPVFGKLSVLADSSRAGSGGLRGYDRHHQPPSAHFNLPSSLKRSASDFRRHPPQQQHVIAGQPDRVDAPTHQQQPCRAPGSPPGAFPAYGSKGTCGQRSQMQDAHTAILNFVHLRVPSSLTSLYKWPETLLPAPAAVPNGSRTVLASRDSIEDSSLETFHYFGVYDGHGGVSASAFCATQLHRRMLASFGGDAGYLFNRRSLPTEPRKEEEGESVQLLGQRADCQAGNFVSTPVTEDFIEEAFHEAFQRVDNEVSASQSEQGTEEYAGSTAVVALVSKSMLMIANCGDSRAVLMRGGKAVQLTSDQTASREDEVARIEGKGGEIYYLQDCARVMGVLAMSRSIGDSYLHPYVIPKPESTIIPRHSDDDFLILGTDGLWDKISNTEACELALRCLARAKAKGASRKAATKCAATVLIRSALSKGTRDNVTVVIVDLRSDEAYEASG